MGDPKSHFGPNEDTGGTEKIGESHGSPQGQKPGGESASAGLVVGVGASAGGLEACSELLRNLPANTGMAFVLVQHLDPHHESILADLLGNYTRMPVMQVHGDIPVTPDHVYVIPPNATMVIVDGILRLSRPAHDLSYQRRPIDAFFTSLAENMRNRAIGVIFSGAASDGTLGLKAIKAEGGITFVQDATAKFDGMPRSAIAAGVVDFVLPPQRYGRDPGCQPVRPAAIRLQSPGARGEAALGNRGSTRHARAPRRTGTDAGSTPCLVLRHEFQDEERPRCSDRGHRERLPRGGPPGNSVEHPRHDRT